MKKPRSTGPKASAPPVPRVDWDLLEGYNALPPAQRAQGLVQLGVTVPNRDVAGILTKSHFVIPGKTRFACTNCGECCRYARKVAQLTYEPCPFLTGDNLCAKHESRYLVCKWFPFWVHHDPKLGDLLTVKPYCPGVGEGPIVDYDKTVRELGSLAAAGAQDNDGAVVIHELLNIPGRKEWAFPSKANIDELMRHLSTEVCRTPALPVLATTRERPGEVAYAHRSTSGLLGSIASPLLTVDRHGGITDANEAACRLFQRDRAGLLARPLSAFFVNPEGVAASVQGCFAQGKQTASPHRLQLPEGSTTHVLVDGQAYRDREDGLVHGLILCLNPATPAAYHEVRQSREYARGLLEASLDALLVIDLDGAIIDVNGAAVQVSGYARERLRGMPFRDLFADPVRARAGVERTFLEGTVRNYELTLVSATREPIPVSFNAAVYRDSEGVVQGVFAAARDIRERLKMVQALKDAQTYSRGLIESCLDLMVTVDRAGVIRDANRAASELTGHPHERLIGAPFASFFDDPARAQEGVRRTFEAGEVRSYGLTLATASGKPLGVSFNATPYRDSSGVVQGIFAVARPTD